MINFVGIIKKSDAKNNLNIKSRTVEFILQKQAILSFNKKIILE